MILQDPTSDPAELTEQVRRVMAREEFQYDKSWFDRLSEWIGRQLEKLFGGDGGDSVTTGGSTFGGGIGSVLAWILIVLAVAAVVAVIVYVVLHRVRRPPTGRRARDRAPRSSTVARAKEWAGDVERLEADGDWKGAMRARYRHLVRTLVDRRQLPDVAGRTTGELREDLADTTPDADRCVRHRVAAVRAGVVRPRPDRARAERASSAPRPRSSWPPTPSRRADGAPDPAGRSRCGRDRPAGVAAPALVIVACSSRWWSVWSSPPGSRRVAPFDIDSARPDGLGAVRLLLEQQGVAGASRAGVLAHRRRLGAGRRATRS